MKGFINGGELGNFKLKLLKVKLKLVEDTSQCGQDLLEDLAGWQSNF